MPEYDLTSILIVWAIFVVLIILVANIKNRSVWSWIGISLLISPLLSLIILIFMSKLPESEIVEEVDFVGVKDLSNDSYKIYLTKKYNIEKNQTLDSFICNEKMFSSLDLALKEADVLEQGGKAAEQVQSTSVGGVNISSDSPNKIETSTQKNTVVVSSNSQSIKYLIIISAVALLGLGSYFLYGKYGGNLGLTEYELSDIKEEKIIKDENYRQVNQYMASLFAKNVVSDKCYQIRLREKDQVNNFCVEIAHLKKIDDKLYVTVTGESYDDDLAPANAHIDSGVIKFFIFNDKGGKLSLEGDSLFKYVGTYGSPNTFVKLVKLDSSGTIGWVTSFGNMHQGYSGGGISIDTLVGQSIKTILSLTTFSDNSGACGDDPACEISTTTANARLVPEKSPSFFPIEVLVKQSVGKAKNMKDISSKYLIEYSPIKKQYVIPKGYDKLYSEF
jgi:hypothetical protein